MFLKKPAQNGNYIRQCVRLKEKLVETNSNKLPSGGYTDQSEGQERRWMAWTVWSLGALFFFYEFLLQIAPSVMSTELRRTFSLTATQFGLLTPSYFIAYSSMQLPAGVFLDRFGPRKLLTIAAGFCAVGTLIFGFAPHFVFLEFGRFITGLGSAFAMLGALVLVANWFPTNRFASLHGLTLTIGMLGAVFGGAPMSLMVERFQWRPSMIALGIAGLVIALLIWFIVRDKPSYHVDNHRAQAGSIRIKDVLSALVGILKHKQSWITAVYGVLMYAPTTALAWWGPSFILSNFHVSVATAAGTNSLMFIGWCVGSPAFGGLSDWVGRRKVPLYISSVGTLICLLGIIYFSHVSLLFLGILMFFFGFFTCGFVPAFSLLREYHAPEASGTALGFMNMVNSLGGAIAPPTVGIILDHVWDGQFADGARVYANNNYHVALTALPVLVLIALIILPFIQETYCRTTGHIRTKHT